VHASHTPTGRPADAAHVRQEKTGPVVPKTPTDAAGVASAYVQRADAAAAAANSSASSCAMISDAEYDARSREAIQGAFSLGRDDSR
jgi:hypothetical protein